MDKKIVYLVSVFSLFAFPIMSVDAFSEEDQIKYNDLKQAKKNNTISPEDKVRFKELKKSKKEFELSQATPLTEEEATELNELKANKKTLSSEEKARFKELKKKAKLFEKANKRNRQN